MLPDHSDIVQLKKEFEKISNWDEWEEFSDKYFDWENTPTRSLEQMEIDLQREPRQCKNQLWEPYARNYDIDPEIEILFDDLSDKIFAKLEPQAHKNNIEHPERYGWKCTHCRVFTRNKTDRCAICGKRLLQLPLNE